MFGEDKRPGLAGGELRCGGRPGSSPRAAPRGLFPSTLCRSTWEVTELSCFANVGRTDEGQSGCGGCCDGTKGRPELHPRACRPGGGKRMFQRRNQNCLAVRQMRRTTSLEAGGGWTLRLLGLGGGHWRGLGGDGLAQRPLRVRLSPGPTTVHRMLPAPACDSWERGGWAPSHLFR